jgi:hypothetical protein
MELEIPGVPVSRGGLGSTCPQTANDGLTSITSMPHAGDLPLSQKSGTTGTFNPPPQANRVNPVSLFAVLLCPARHVLSVTNNT